MKTDTSIPLDVNRYIADFPKETQVLLEQMRATIKKAAPKAEEVISYRMPAYKYNGILVYFAGYKKHIGFYPTGSGIKAFKKELSVYKGAKGSVQFPLDKPLPIGLITKIVKLRIEENNEKALAKISKPKDNFLSSLVAPAKRALENAGIKTLKQLSSYTEAEISKLHGMGPSTMPKLRTALKNEGLKFKK